MDAATLERTRQSKLSFKSVKRSRADAPSGKGLSVKDAESGSVCPTLTEAAVPTRSTRSHSQAPATPMVAASVGNKQKTKQATVQELLRAKKKDGRQAAHPTPAPAPVPATSEGLSTRSSARLAPAAADKQRRGTGCNQHEPSTRSRAAVKSGADSASKRKAGGSAVRFHDTYELYGEEYKVGDVVYVMQTEDMDLLPDDCADDCCVACGKGHKPQTIIECDRCLGGYHMACLVPPLRTVPQGAWVCPDCDKGVPPGTNRKLRTAYEMFLLGPSEEPVIALGLITGIVENRCGDGEVEFRCRYFCRPQDTHQGRLPHNSSREVFLTTDEHYESVLAIFGAAVVCPSGEFDAQEGIDVYCCDYEYDIQWKRFRRRVYKTDRGSRGAPGSDGDSDFDAAGEAVSSDDEDCVRDRTFKPIYAFWAERGMLPNGYRGRAAAPARRPRALNRQAAELAAATGANGLTGREDDAAVLELVGGGASSQPAARPPPRGSLLAARDALAAAAPVGALPCRDSEKAQLSSFVRSAITEEGGTGPGVLYVCGVPGTGKTACISEVLHNCRPQARAHNVQLIFLNALSLPTPTHVYCKLWEKLAGQRVGPGRALAALEARFSPVAAGAPRAAVMTLLVVDEIDVLITKDQSVLYNLFEWPVRPGARLAVIGVSNTHDLDDRVLPRISSRLASAKLVFHAYSAAQLQAIVGARLAGAGCEATVKKVALALAARKVASTSGDVRRVLELLRRAAEMADTERRTAGNGSADTKDAVTEKHVQMAVAEMFGSPQLQYLRACSCLEKLTLVALLLELRATAKSDASITAVHSRLVNHVALLERDALCDGQALCRAVFELAAKRLLITGPPWQGLKARVALNVHKDDVSQAVREDASLAPVHGQLS